MLRSLVEQGQRNGYWAEDASTAIRTGVAGRECVHQYVKELVTVKETKVLAFKNRLCAKTCQRPGAR